MQNYPVLRRQFQGKCAFILCVLLASSVMHSMPVEADSDGSSAESSPIVKLEEAVSLARQEAARIVGKDIDRYVMTEVKFQPKYVRWRAFFEAKEPPYTYDSCFKVFVNDHTKETEFQACP